MTLLFVGQTLDPGSLTHSLTHSLHVYKPTTTFAHQHSVANRNHARCCKGWLLKWFFMFAGCSSGFSLAWCLLAAQVVFHWLDVCWLLKWSFAGLMFASCSSVFSLAWWKHQASEKPLEQPACETCTNCHLRHGWFDFPCLWIYITSCKDDAYASAQFTPSISIHKHNLQ